MPKQNSFFFDFDSTLVTVESFDEVLKLALEDSEDKINLIKKVEHITDMGMNGEIDLEESLDLRFQLTEIQKKNFDFIDSTITQKITPGIKKIIKFLQEKKQKIFIISGGFLSTILPVAKILKIPTENCFANDYFVNEKNIIKGFDKKNPLVTSDGKNKILKNLKKDKKCPGKIFFIGDGQSDLNTYLEKKADFFYGFGVNILRENIKKDAPYFFTNCDDLLKEISQNF